MLESPKGKVLAIAVRTAERGPMKELDSAAAVVDGGLVDDIPVSPDRGITFISAEQWREVTAELRADLPWHTRRANVLVQGLKLADLKGRHIRVGEVEVAIEDETAPCGLMDRAHRGLKTALKPDCRGGVYGRVIRAGSFKVGDDITVTPA